MNAKTLKALKRSIAHWYRLMTGKRRKGETVGVLWCNLCKLFNTYTTPVVRRCFGCPVYKDSKHCFCIGTPYGKADRAAELCGLDSPEFKAAAKDEYIFLKSLLPKNKKTIKTK